MAALTLDQLTPGQRARVLSVRDTETVLYQRILEMGLFESTEIVLIRFAPLGDPLEIQLHGYNLSLRKTEARLVEVEIVL
jgi:Fe2+ transport system protein FeoA